MEESTEFWCVEYCRHLDKAGQTCWSVVRLDKALELNRLALQTDGPGEQTWAILYIGSNKDCYTVRDNLVRWRKNKNESIWEPTALG